MSVDLECQTSRIPAVLGGPTDLSFGVVRRWGSGEEHVAFDVDALSVGQLRVTDAAGGPHMPPTVYLCPEACLADPDQQCVHDNIEGIVWTSQVAEGDARV